MATDPEHYEAHENEHGHEGGHQAEHDPDDASQSPTMVHLIQRSLPVVILLAVVAGLYLYLHYMDQGPQPEQGPQSHQGPPPKVQVMRVKAQDVPYTPDFLGQTEAYKRVEIQARINGFLQERTFEQGTQVEQGQLLFQIDPRTYQADLEIAQAQVQTGKATLHRARQQVERYQRLVKDSAATPSELENWQTQAEVAAANIKTAQARVAKAKLNLSYTKIRAPMSGLIGKAQKDVGAYVDPGANSLLAVEQQTDPIYVRYNISESDLLRWRTMEKQGELSFPDKQNLPIRIILADETPYDHTGRIDFMDVAIDPTTGTAVIRAKVPNPDNQLRPGQYVHVRLMGIKRVNAVLIPQSAVIQNPTGASIYLLGENGKVEQRTVKLGAWVGKQWVVESGLKPGEQLITDNLTILQPKMPVQVVKAGDEEKDMTREKTKAKPDAS